MVSRSVTQPTHALQAIPLSPGGTPPIKAKTTLVSVTSAQYGFNSTVYASLAANFKGITTPNPCWPSLMKTRILIIPLSSPMCQSNIGKRGKGCHRTIDIGPDACLAFGRDHREARQPLRTGRFGDRTLRYRNAQIRTRSEGKDVEANEREERRRVERRTNRSAGREV